jgi:hypothetical protein
MNSNMAKYLNRKTILMHLFMNSCDKSFRWLLVIKSERLSANIKLTLHKALIRSVMTYAYPAWEFAAECQLLKLQRLQNKVLRTTDNFPKRTSVRDMHEVFRIPCVYDYITKSCRQQAEVIQNHKHENVRYIGQGEARHGKYKRRSCVRLFK